MPPPYARGHIRAPNKDHLILLSHLQHGRRLQAMHVFETPAVYDCTDLLGPVKDQGQCGSCWDFSGTAVVEGAFAKAGMPVVLSEQYTLSCARNGGCNGDDNTTVLDWAKKTGLPSTADYGSYQGSPGSCKFTSAMKMYKLDDWGFADSNGGQGVTKTQDIKNAMIAYGPIGCAVAAGSSWDSWSSDPNYVHKGGSTNIDHDVTLVGWDDAKQAWKMRNSWSPGWAWGGYGWIAYGADSIGTEAVFAIVRGSPTPIDWGGL